jgi:hypothetical protein
MQEGSYDCFSGKQYTPIMRWTFSPSRIEVEEGAGAHRKVRTYRIKDKSFQALFELVRRLPPSFWDPLAEAHIGGDPVALLSGGGHYFLVVRTERGEFTTAPMSVVVSELEPLIFSANKMLPRRKRMPWRIEFGSSMHPPSGASLSRPNKSLQPTPTAVTPPAAQEIVPAVGVAEH